MSFLARLHAYQDLGFYEEPILSEEWYEIDNPEIDQHPEALERFFRIIANDFAREYSDQIDPSILNDFNWGDFIAEIPEEFLHRHRVSIAYSANVKDPAVIVFVHHDELILEL